jgi:hypothetical protein
MAGEIICWVGDGSTPTSDERAKGVVRALDADNPDVFVFGGDIYPDGTATDLVNFDQIYGSTAPGASDPGADMRSVMYHTIGNHEYVTFDANDDPNNTNDWWIANQASTAMGAPDLTKTDPLAAYTGLSSADAQVLAAAQWSHLKYVDIGVWRLLFLDCGVAGAVEGRFPTAGNYYDAVAALITATERRRLIIFTHFPRYSACTSHGDRTNMSALWTLAADNALAMFGGHDHCVQRQQPRNSSGTVVAQKSGCVQFVSGNGGTSLNTLNAGYTPAIAFGEDTTWGYYRITLTNTTEAEFEYVSLGTSPATGSPTVTDSVTLFVEDGPSEIVGTVAGAGTTSGVLTVPPVISLSPASIVWDWRA